MLDINPEGKLQREIKDILEELDILLYVKRTQRTVLQDFIVHVEHILDPHGYYSSENRRRGRDVPTVGLGGTPAPYTAMGLGIMPTPLLPVAESPMFTTRSPAISSDDERRREACHKMYREKEQHRMVYDWFKINAKELLEKVTQHIEELEQLKQSADTTSNSVKDLLALKQQQASVVQAWQSVKQAEESVSQGRSIMIFTIVTITFVSIHNRTLSPGIFFFF